LSLRKPKNPTRTPGASRLQLPNRVKKNMSLEHPNSVKAAAPVVVPSHRSNGEGRVSLVTLEKVAHNSAVV